MSRTENKHFRDLQKSYQSVGDKTWEKDDFNFNNLEISKSLFIKNSLKSGSPIPKKLKVIALLSGLPFSRELQEVIISLQDSISQIIDNKIHYWVKPLNFGIEYCVFKWPGGDWDRSWMKILNDQLNFFEFKSYSLQIQGVQINEDGCVILKGYDEQSSLFNIREYMKNNIYFFPKRQSRWAHIPIGRILEPLGEKNFINLKKFVQSNSKTLFHIEKIRNVKLVNEERWYMEERKILKKVPLFD